MKTVRASPGFALLVVLFGIATLSLFLALSIRQSADFVAIARHDHIRAESRLLHLGAVEYAAIHALEAVAEDGGLAADMSVPLALPRFLLSGLIKCGVCDSGFVKISQHHFGCASARNKGTCANRRTIRRDVLEATVLNGLQHHLMEDELLAVFCEEYTRHLNALRMAETGNRARDEAKLVKITRDLDRLVDAIIDGVPAERVKGRMEALEALEALEAERAELEARLCATPKR